MSTTPLPDDALAAPEPPAIGSRWPMLVGLLMATMVVMLDNSVLNVALPSIGRELEASASQLQWIVSAYSVTFGGLLLTTGNLGDRLGRRRVLVMGMAVMATGSVLVLATTTATMLIAVRALIGVGAALVMPSTLSLLYTTFEGGARQKVMGIWAIAGMLGQGGGPLVAGLILEHADWRWLFLLNIPVALIGIPLALATVRESTSPTVLLGFGVVLLILAAFGVREKMARYPMLNPRLVLRRAFAIPAAVEAATYAGMAGAMFVQTQLVQGVLGLTPVQAGLAQLPALAAVILVNGVITRFATTRSPRTVVTTGLLVLAVGAGVVAIAPGSLICVIAGMAVLIIGMRIALPAAALLVIDALPRERAGMGSALNDTFQEVGGALGIAIVGAVLAQGYRLALPGNAPQVVRESLYGIAAEPAWADAARSAFLHGSTWAFAAAALLQVVVALTAWIALRPRTALPEEASDAAELAVEGRLQREEPVA
ncbi:MFS transporter [Propioniciclava flava]|uniref:Major facilitator superfamily (MFS) profile domain-containing protein n=1 Tax=Propioniciclava flava TaxID=2072026 RepID=A0A4Q2EJ03_9ACTN|nr:MFS transporter [Propioniciclava flava]RXW32666.1 hypothetical protein C1706_05835 [Propioniciclava flava]